MLIKELDLIKTDIIWKKKLKLVKMAMTKYNRNKCNNYET